jgi:hypothetical protein
VADGLLQVEPDANVHPQQATNFLDRAVGGLAELQVELAGMAERRAEDLLAAHERVRSAARIRGVSHNIRPQDTGRYPLVAASPSTKIRIFGITRPLGDS